MKRVHCKFQSTTTGFVPNLFEQSKIVTRLFVQFGRELKTVWLIENSSTRWNICTRPVICFQGSTEVREVMVEGSKVSTASVETLLFSDWTSGPAGDDDVTGVTPRMRLTFTPDQALTAAANTTRQKCRTCKKSQEKQHCLSASRSR